MEKTYQPQKDIYGRVEPAIAEIPKKEEEGLPKILEESTQYNREMLVEEIAGFLDEPSDHTVFR